MQWCGPPATRESSAQGLAVDADHALGAEALAELAQNCFQTLRVQCTEDIAERVVAGDAVPEFKELPQQFLPPFAEELELGAGLGASQRRRQRNDEDIHQNVLGIAGTRILERSKHPPEIAHFCLLPESGDIRRIQFEPLCNTPPRPYAIPLLRGGERVVLT
jgi:hypothetical protein